MNNNSLFRKYRFKFYLNASHYIFIDGVKGETHPHTWEFVVDILMTSDSFVQFNQYEKDIEVYFEKFQNKVINDFSPFDVTIPTLENMSEHFIFEIRDIVQSNGGRLYRFEASETPTRSYILSFENDDELMESIRKERADRMVEIIDHVIGRIME